MGNASSQSVSLPQTHTIRSNSNHLSTYRMLHHHGVSPAHLVSRLLQHNRAQIQTVNGDKKMPSKAVWHGMDACAQHCSAT
jgi:hypothetical protein